MIYAMSIACSEAEGLRSKTCGRTFEKPVKSWKKLFFANVAAKVAITPKNSEKFRYAFIFVKNCVLCQKTPYL